MKRITVPLKYNNEVVGTCEIEYDKHDVKIISSNITDTKLSELLEESSPSFSIKNTKIEE